MAKYPLTEMAVNMFCPGNVVQLDDAGLPSVLVWIPAFKNSDVLTGGDDSIHPAFIVNGVQIPGFYYSKYQNVVYNGKAYSLPAEDPAVNVNFDTAREYCEAKGYGWHLSTAAEWAAIALWCKKNGFLPYGNNNNGKDSRETECKAIPSYVNGDGTIGRVATGTGPLTWSNDGTASGIWDMNGNVWEWQGGLRLVWGELQILANNDAADPDNPQNATSTCWKAINAADGSLVDPECKTTDSNAKLTGNTVKLDYVNGAWKYSANVTNLDSQYRACGVSKVTCSEDISEAAIVLLRSMALLPDEGATSSDYPGNMWCKNGENECCISRGGDWGYGSHAGLFSLRGIDTRWLASEAIGIRAVYIPNI